jgi:hypothetical protein
MAMYLCDLCKHLLDDDYSPCVEHPQVERQHLFCCEDCKEKLEALDELTTLSQEAGEYDI